MTALLLSKFAQFREREEFIDVRLKVGKDVFPAHRNVLAANSDYFYAMFTGGMRETNQEVIELKNEDISADALRIVLDSIYSGDELIIKENVFEVLATANHLQVTNVVQQCCDCLDKELIQRQFDVQAYRQLTALADLLGLKNLQEATQRKMASMYKDVCESEEFLSHIDADQLSSLLSRDDLSAPSESFVFKSVMQWVKYKKEERMAVAAKVIGAVRLGLVDIKEVVDELNTEEMQRVPEIQALVSQVLLHNHMPSPSSKFAVEKAKPRSMSPVLVAVFPGRSQVSQALLPWERAGRPARKLAANQMKYFDVETNAWKSFPFMATLDNVTACFCTEYVGNYLYVATNSNVIYCYHTVNNVWEKLPCFETLKRAKRYQTKCLCSVDDYIHAITESGLPQRYSVAQNKWQSGSALPFLEQIGDQGTLVSVAAVVMKSRIYVLHGYCRIGEGWLKPETAVVHCFDPQKNEWKQKAWTSHPHFGSSLLVDNNKLYVAGGKISCRTREGKLIPHGDPAPVEVYDEVRNRWSVVEQKHIPPNNLDAVEIGEKVYFIVNKFPVDSGIRIPPGEVYHMSLHKWEEGGIGRISENAVLCYLPVKKDSLKAKPLSKENTGGMQHLLQETL